MTSIKKIKVLIVDDSAYSRTVIGQMIKSDERLEIIGVATDGVDAITKTLRLKPDVITLDLEMPNMDGFTFLRWLMRECPTPVLVLSSKSDSRSIFRALELGAVDFLVKPESRNLKGIEGIRDDLVAKLYTVANLEMSKVKLTVNLLSREQAPQAARKEDEVLQQRGPVDIIAIGASTGGPPAIQAILAALPGDLSAAVVIAQHMPAGFTKTFAERLNKLSPLAVSEATDGDRVRPGTVFIAPGGHHLLIRKDDRGLAVEILLQNSADLYVPSADRMMISIAEACGPAALGIVLTGMGRDGVQGVIAIKNKRGQCLAESKDSAIIFGMPQEAIRTGAVDKVLPLHKIADEIIMRCKSDKDSVQEYLEAR